ncbi:hypothetical protein [Methylobacterium sp. A52T]
MPKAKIEIIALDRRFNKTEVDCITAVLFWVRDRDGRTRAYDEKEEAMEAAQTFEALGYVLLDDPEPADLDAEERAADAIRQEHDEAVSGILGDLIDDAEAETALLLSAQYPHDQDEIAAIGPLSKGRMVVPAEDGLHVTVDAGTPDARSMLMIPRGIAPWMARAIIDAWDAGHRRGFGEGQADMVSAMTRHAVPMS